MNPIKRQTAVTVRQSKGQQKLVAMTCYDATFARLVDPVCDIVLVGDSLGMVIQGAHDTLGVTLDDVIYHTKAVARGLTKAHLVADLPFGTYQASAEQAIRSASRLLSEAGAQAVKIEGGVYMAPTVRHLTQIGIPVMGHIGLTPQSVHQFGGFKVQGRQIDAQTALVQDAKALQEAGAYAIVLEAIPADLAKAITAELQIPTIGIGAGPECDGQVLVLYDLLGLNPDFTPKFVKHYASGAAIVRESVGAFAAEVRSKAFPTGEHSF